VAHRAAPNTTGSGLRPSFDTFVDWIQRHVYRLATRAPVRVTVQARRGAPGTSMTPSYHRQRSTVHRPRRLASGRLAAGWKPLGTPPQLRGAHPERVRATQARRGGR
jgi:hypothetical protein